MVFASNISRLLVVLCLILCLPLTALAEESKDRIAVIPVLDNSPPGVNAAQNAAGKVEIMLNRISRFELLDSSAVAAVVGQMNSDGVAAAVWQDVASELALDYVILLSVGPATVEYLGEQFDHLSVGEPGGQPGTVHLYEAAVTIRATIRDLTTNETLLDEEVTGKKVERYRQSYDAAKYAMIVSVVRELAAIFDNNNTPSAQENISGEHLALVNEALNKAVNKLERPVRRTLES